MTAGGVALLGVVLLIVGYLVPVALLVWIGWAALVVALILLLVAGIPRHRDRL